MVHPVTKASRPCSVLSTATVLFACLTCVCSFAVPHVHSNHPLSRSPWDHTSSPSFWKPTSSSSQLHVRKRKRKVLTDDTDGHDESLQQQQLHESSSGPTDTAESNPTDNRLRQTDDSEPVSLQVNDIRQVIVQRNKKSSSTVDNSVRTTRSPIESPAINTPIAAMDQKPTQQPATTTRVSPSAPMNGNDDALAQLLRDAQEMRQAENKEQQDSMDSANSFNPWQSDNNSVASSSSSSFISQLRNAVSTLVVADFFLVCFFLVWFLAGIFSSYVFRDDTIQIAFNSNFQQLVQPALGVLMIGALASAVVKDEEQD